MSSGPPEAQAGPAPDVRRWLPVLGFIAGIVGMLPKLVSPPINTADRVEFADHVVPGVVVLVLTLAYFLLVRGRGGVGHGVLPLSVGLVVLLAGFWMLATHLPLVAQAFRGEAPWVATIYHTSTALVVLGVGLLWCTVHWGDLAEADSAAAPAKAPKRAGP